METLWYDLSYAIRTLFKNAGFTFVAVLSLAIGIGANSAIFSVTNALLLRPLPYKDADRLVILWSRSPGLNVPQDWFSPGQYLDVKTQNSVFDETSISIGGSFTPWRSDGPRARKIARIDFSAGSKPCEPRGSSARFASVARGTASHPSRIWHTIGGTRGLLP